jgi:mannose-6-phosphate isomerase
MKQGIVKLVEKPWGREIWVAVTDQYALKIIEINKGARSSLQYHEQKHEHIYIDRGKLQMERDNADGVLETLILGPGEVIENAPGCRHRSTALENTRIIEVSSPHLDDVVRLEDDYGR